MLEAENAKDARASTSKRSTRCPPISMPRIVSAATAASAAVFAVFTPPAFPRFPVGICALTTTGPKFAAKSRAWSGETARPPAGVAMPASARSGLATCSSKFKPGLSYLPYLRQ